MPKPVKSRRIYGMPEYCCFVPQESSSETVMQTLSPHTGANCGHHGHSEGHACVEHGCGGQK